MSRADITIPRHPYSRDEQSGAGNCWCGRAQASRLHPEHEAVPAGYDPRRCVCGWPVAEHTTKEEQP
jgi:hypothetical protein